MASRQAKTEKKIMVVEDDPDILESIEITLSKAGYQVTAVLESKKVLKHLESFTPDLIIMDVMMPPPDGFELCRLIKADERTKSVPIVLLSARTRQAEVEMGFQSGADRYLAKPFMNEELIKTIELLLKEKET